MPCTFYALISLNSPILAAELDQLSCGVPAPGSKGEHPLPVGRAALCTVGDGLASVAVHQASTSRQQ